MACDSHRSEECLQASCYTPFAYFTLIFLLYSRSEVAEDIPDDGAPLTWQDKVKVMRSRKHINDLDATVKEKEEVVAYKKLVRHFSLSFQI